LASRALRIGLVGCGRIAERGWIPAISRVPGAELVAVADTDLLRCAAIAPAARAHTTAEDLLADGGIDAVVVATPAAAHVNDARAVAAAGLQSIVEKPPAPDAAEARVLAGLDPSPWIGFNRRFQPWLQDARARIPERGQLSIRLIFHYRRASWAPRVVADEALLDLGSHLIDLASWLSDSPICRVRTAVRTQDRCSLELELERGKASLSCATDRVYRELTEVRAADSSLAARQSRGGVVRGALARLRPGNDGLIDSLTGQLTAFCACVSGKDQGEVATAADGVAVMDAIDAARRSLVLGSTWVEVPPAARTRLR
jgi:myo-inositol 2-dehydrogenase / D-chiro-inositol 1-dehydrogenase